MPGEPSLPEVTVYKKRNEAQKCQNSCSQNPTCAGFLFDMLSANPSLPTPRAGASVRTVIRARTRAGAISRQNVFSVCTAHVAYDHTR